VYNWLSQIDRLFHNVTTDVLHASHPRPAVAL
jgi:hypothetical protein